MRQPVTRPARITDTASSLTRAICLVSLVGVAATLGACSSDSGPSGAAVLLAGRVLGRVELAAGQAPPSCLVRIPSVARAARCDGDGNFDIKAVSAGARELEIVLDPDSDDRIVVRRRVPVGVNPGFLTNAGALQIAEAGSIGGRVTLAGKAPPFSIISIPRFGAVTAATKEGGYLLPTVPPGKHTVVLTTSEGGQTSVSNIEVKPGENTNGVDFNLSNVVTGNVDVLGVAKREGKADGEHGDLTVALLELRDGKVVKSVKTQADGGFSLSAPLGLYALRVSDDNNPIAPTVPYLLLHGEGPVALTYVVIVPAPDGDLDGDGVANDKDDDADGDGVPNTEDALPYDPSESKDADKDSLGDRADLRSKGGDSIDSITPTPDTDGDTKFDFEDNCKTVKNPDQKDLDLDRVGDACDNCPGVPNPLQTNSVPSSKQGDACRVCVQDAACLPANTCQQGRLVCGATAVCAAIGTNQPNGKSCGTGQVCKDGSCNACLTGEPCVPAANKCNVGKLDCSSGSGSCTDTNVAAPEGTVCDTGKVCRGGACVACQSGASCPATDLCREGKLDCSTGQSQCLPGANKADGSACGNGFVCQTGACIACQTGASCDLTTKPCNAGVLDCSSGAMMCVDSTMPAPDGKSCGAAFMACKAGACVTLPNKLAIVAGDNQSANAGARLGPITVKLANGSGTAIVGEILTIIASPGASLQSATATTDTSGQIAFAPQLGPQVGAQSFVVRSASAGELTISATATPPPAGKARAIVNRDQISGTTTKPTAAVDARMATPSGLAIASDGTVYIADKFSSVVYVLRPDGVLDIFAGGGSATGDGGPARDATFSSVADVTLDQQNKVLYIVDRAAKVVRAVDLSTSGHIIRTVAGGGSSGAPSYGDGGLAVQATLYSPSGVSVAPDGALWISDAGLNKIRRVDPVTKLISTVVASDCSGTLGLSSCGGISCRTLWRGNALYFSANLCGSAVIGGPGIVRRDPDGSLHLVGGGVQVGTGTRTPGSDARLTHMQPDWLAFDSAGNLLYSEPGHHTVRRIDARTRVVSNVAGTGSPGTPADFADAATAPLSSPARIVFDGDDLLIADGGNHALRRVPLVDIKTATTAQLAIAGGAGQTVKPTDLTPLPLEVKLSAGGQPLARVRVELAQQDESMWLSASSAVSASDGVALVSARVGTAPGSYTVTATLRDIHGAHISGSPALFSITASTPSVGTIFSTFNIFGTGGGLGQSGAATLARSGGPYGLAIASNGTIYMAVDNTIVTISPRGIYQHYAGTGTPGFFGDNGAAAAAQFAAIRNILLDEPRQRLYIVDSSNGSNTGRIRMIDMSSPSAIVTTVAGGGSSTLDNVPATAATLPDPSALALDAAGNLYISDLTRRAVFVVDAATQLIRTLLPPASNCASETLALRSRTSSDLPLAPAASGGVYLAGYLCGSVVGGNAWGVVHVSASGALTHVAGHASGSTSEGAQATAYKLDGAYGLARDGNTLYLGNFHTRIMKLTIGGTISTFAGTGVGGFGGDHGAATAAQLNGAWVFAPLAGGHLLISDYYNSRLRVVW